MRHLLGLILAIAASAATAQQVDPYPLPPREWPHPVMDHETFTYVLLDRFEYRARSANDAWAWSAQGWWGGDRHRLWLKTQGEGEVGGPAERGDVQALYARRVSPYWHLQAGVRQDARPTPSRSTGVLAIQGLAPYWFNVEASAFFGDGRVSGRLAAEYDQLLTQRLILQPHVESNWSGSGDPERGLRSGIEDVELGFRLRYEIRREFAPYVGVNWTNKVGERRETALVLGVRMWY